MRVYLTSLGCRLNEGELENWAVQFQARQCLVTQDNRNADLVVVNTCAVTAEAAKKSRQLIRLVRRHNPAAKLVVSGCYASLDEDLSDHIDEIDLVVHNRDKDRLPELALRELQADTMPLAAGMPARTALFARGRHRAFIKIQDGCRYRCSFCIVTIARGKERSRTIKEIVDQIKGLHQQGVHEIVLTGVHIGGYGHDIGTDLYRLIDAILEQTAMPRIRLSSIEPWNLPRHFFSLFQHARLLPHLHIPLQSGSDSVLKRMARRCRTKDFEALVNTIRDSIEDVNLSTDIIVGFPGETDAEWQEGLRFIEKIGCSHCHIFTYSSREGTRSASMPGQIPMHIKKQRSRDLHELEKKMRHQFLLTQLGRQDRVLWEKKNSIGQWTGYTENYIHAQLDPGNTRHLANQISTITIQSLDKTPDKGRACLAVKLAT